MEGQHTRVELCISKKLDEVHAVTRHNVVALEVESYVAERLGIAVDVQRFHVVGTAAITM